MDWVQALVNAQVSVNRANFLQNVRHNRQFHPLMTDEDLSEEKILRHMKEARSDLDKAIEDIETYIDEA